MKISKHIIWREIENEIFIIDPSKQMAYELNETASAIFKLISKNKDLDFIKNDFLKNYDVDIKEVESDINSIISNLKGEGIVYE